MPSSYSNLVPSFSPPRILCNTKCEERDVHKINDHLYLFLLGGGAGPSLSNGGAIPSMNDIVLMLQIHDTKLQTKAREDFTIIKKALTKRPSPG